MRKLNIYRYAILAFSSVLLLSACSDNKPTLDPPEIPDLSEARPSFDYFNSSAKVKEVMGDNYKLASSLAQSMEMLMTTFSSLPESFLDLANQEDPDFDNGVWTWEKTQSNQSESFTIRLEAERTNTRVNWAMYISANTQELIFDNLKLFDGFVLNDSNEGEWSIYAFQEGNNSQSVMTYDWIIESNDVALFNFTFDSNNASSLSYVKNSPDNTITVNGDNQVTIIYWNSSDGTGYYDTTNQDRVCWDSSSNNTPCTGA